LFESSEPDEHDGFDFVKIDAVDHVIFAFKDRYGNFNIFN